MGKDQHISGNPHPVGHFPTTHWSAVLAAADSQSEQSATALAELCRLYWYPLYMFVRRSGHDAEDAQDLTQSFFARLIEKRYLSTADPERGRFRCFLLTALKRFLANEWDRANRSKRGCGHKVLSLDCNEVQRRYAIEPIEDVTPEVAYHRQWGSTLLAHVLDRLEAEYTKEERRDHFVELKACLTCDMERGRYDQTAARLEMSPGALRTAVHRLRQRYRELLRSEIAHTVVRSEEIEEEIRYLFAALSR